MSISRVYLSPGFFGFSTLGAYDYFFHVEDQIRRRYREAGRGVEIHLVDVQPTASIRRRAASLLARIEETDQGAGPIHLIGHSTGGLDARLLASPTMNIHGVALLPRWAGRVRSVTTVNTPHYGTPLASFFATLSGQRLLYALSALTFTVLKLGAPPLALSSSLVAAFSGIERAVGLRLRIIENLTDRTVQLLDGASSRELSEFLQSIRKDQGAMIQLMPESMDLFQAGVEDNPEVLYQSVASYAPKPGVVSFARWLLPPWSNLSFPIFAALHRLASMENENYPCEPEDSRADDALRAMLGFDPPEQANDGVVPLRSQVWGKLIWAGSGDHLDVVGHFAGRGVNDPHVDWLGSGCGFDRDRFDAVFDAIVTGQLNSEKG